MVHLRNHLNRLLIRWNHLRDSHPREVRAAFGVTVASAIVCVLAAGWFLLSLSRSLPDQQSITRMTEMDQATAVYDASDSLVFTIFKEHRTEVPLDAMGPYLVKALVAVEDQRFYDHHGFDAIRIVGAALNNVWLWRRMRNSNACSSPARMRSTSTSSPTAPSRARAPSRRRARTGPSSPQRSPGGTSRCPRRK